MVATTPPQGAVPVLRISTAVFPERDRLAGWREFYGRKFLRLEHEPLSDLPLHVEVTLRPLPGLGIVAATLPPLRVGRTAELLTDGNDAIVMQISSTSGVAAQRGRQAAIDPGDAVALSNADIGTFTFPSGSELLGLSLPRSEFDRLVRDPDAVLVRVIPGENEALWLLKRYIGIFGDAPTLAAPELQHLAIAHVYDLLALAFGATREAAEIANGRGLRAARLRAAKDFILRQLGRHELSVATVAAHLGVTPRYVHMLFETEDESFSEFVLEKRLARAHRMLRDPRTDDRAISAIALEAGFGDLSYFNRTFRRRYGATPSDVRAGSRKRE